MLRVSRAFVLTALPDYADLSLDSRTVIVIGLLALCAGLAFGVVPALSVGRADSQDALRDESRGASETPRSRRLRGALVAGQIALCLSLLAGAGQLTRSLWAMTHRPFGFEPDGVLSAAIRLPSRDYPTREARARFLEQFVERLRTIAGVESAASATSLPTAIRSRMTFTIEGASNDPERFVLYASVSDDYFKVLKIPLRAGRMFDAQDRADTPPTVVISESMAQRHWPGGAALGTRIRIGSDAGSALMEVIGIVGDVRNDPARPDAEPMVYRSIRQNPQARASVLLRTHGDPLTLVKSVRRELAALDATLPLDREMTLRAVLSEALADRRVPVFFVTGFGALTLALASVGVYAMFAGIVAAREREIGVRMALGSRPRAVAGLILRQGAGWMLAGLAAGALGVVLVVQLLRALLYQRPSFNPVALGITVIPLLGCAAIALLIPLRRAMRVDPAVTLRAQ